MDADKGGDPRVLVLGLGNELFGDDGFGLQALRRVAGMRDWPAAVSFVEAGQGIGLCGGQVAGAELVLALDAVLGGGPPGTIYEFEVGSGGDAPPGPAGRSDGRGDAHTASLVETVVLARWLAGRPERAVVIGVEPLCAGPGLALTEPVRGALEQAVGRAVEIIDRFLARGARYRGEQRVGTEHDRHRRRVDGGLRPEPAQQDSALQ